MSPPSPLYLVLLRFPAASILLEARFVYRFKQIYYYYINAFHIKLQRILHVMHPGFRQYMTRFDMLLMNNLDDSDLVYSYFVFL